VEEAPTVHPNIETPYMTLRLMAKPFLHTYPADPFGRSLRATVLFWLLASLTAPSLPARAAGTLDPASIRETIFPNGLRLLIKEAHAVNLVTIQYWVRTGGFRETEKTQGAAHFIEHLIFKGTDRYPQGGIDAEIEDLGGVLTAVTEKDWVMFGTTVASQYAFKALDVLGDALRHPKFRPADLELERRVIAEEIAAQRLEPDRVVMARLFRMAYPHHPYGDDVLGTTEAVSRMNRATVQQFFADQYTPSNATLVIVGDVDPAALLPRVRNAFGVDTTPGSPVPPKLPPPDPMPPASRETITGESREAYLGIAFPAPAVTDPDVYAMDVLVTLLEQGTYGRLPAALAGTASRVKATYETRRQPGLLTIVAGAPPAALPRVEATVLGIIRDLARKGPTEAEVMSAKSLLAGSYAVDNETFAGQANSLGYYASIDRWQFAVEYLPRISRVTPAQVRAAAAKYLDPDHAVTVVLRPVNDKETKQSPAEVGTRDTEARRQ
jgi:zinc protease